MASLGVLAAGVAHELNTPLGVVLSSADQLSLTVTELHGEGSRPERLAGLCLEGARRAAQIVADLRNFSRPEAQAVQPIDVHDCLASTLRLLAPTLGTRGITVEESYGELPLIEGFPALVNQTLTNLVLNSAAAMDAGGRIRISTAAVGDDKVQLVVEDDGPGIPLELRNRIFEPFFTTKAPGEGTGLGLSLCFTFIDQHGGRIWEEGRPGRGARFVVELPVKQDPVRAARRAAPYALLPGQREP